MFTGKLRRVGNSVVLTVPADEIERLGLVVGQLVAVERRGAPADARPELATRMEALLAVHGPALDYLRTSERRRVTPMTVYAISRRTSCAHAAYLEARATPHRGLRDWTAGERRASPDGGLL